MDNLPMHAVFSRMEDILLNSVYESVSHARPVASPNELSDEISRAYTEGFDDCLDVLWRKIQERGEVNDIQIAQMEKRWNR
jgi:hypothetical protein